MPNALRLYRVNVNTVIPGTGALKANELVWIDPADARWTDYLWMLTEVGEEPPHAPLEESAPASHAHVDTGGLGPRVDDEG